jgi:predicted RNA binding protein YcfA (HicA-like mRNA interferase family)
LPLLSPLPDGKRLRRLYEQVIRNRKNCGFDDLERLLLAVGFTERRASGSHRTFKLGAIVLTVPERKPIKENYVDQVIAIMQELGFANQGAPEEGHPK